MIFGTYDLSTQTYKYLLHYQDKADHETSHCTETSYEAEAGKEDETIGTITPCS